LADVSCVAETSGHVCELLTAMQSGYSGHFAALTIGSRRQQIHCVDGALTYVDALPVNRQMTPADRPRMLFTCKVFSVYY